MTTLLYFALYNYYLYNSTYILPPRVRAMFQENQTSLVDRKEGASETRHCRQKAAVRVLAETTPLMSVEYESGVAGCYFTINEALRAKIRLVERLGIGKTYCRVTSITTNSIPSRMIRPLRANPRSLLAKQQVTEARR